MQMDGFSPSATTPSEYLKGTPVFRTDLYATCGTPMSHIEHIHLLKRYGRMHTPELKAYTRRDASMPTYNQIRSKVNLNLISKHADSIVQRSSEIVSLVAS